MLHQWHQWKGQRAIGAILSRLIPEYCETGKQEVRNGRLIKWKATQRERESLSLFFLISTMSLFDTWWKLAEASVQISWLCNSVRQCDSVLVVWGLQEKPRKLTENKSQWCFGEAIFLGSVVLLILKGNICLQTGRKQTQSSFLLTGRQPPANVTFVNEADFIKQLLFSMARKWRKPLQKVNIELSFVRIEWGLFTEKSLRNVRL